MSNLDTGNDAAKSLLDSETPPRPHGEQHRLRAGSLSMVDIAAATMANIGPAMSFYFGFAFLAATAGVASPLTIIAAGIAVALLGNTLAEFSKAQPSAGGFITFVGKTFGATTAVTTALLVGIGYIIAMASVIAISGGFFEITVAEYLGWHVPWIVWTLLLTAIAVVMMVRGIAISTKLAGWENSAALAEETDNPRRNVPRAVLLSVAVMCLSYVLFAYATVTGFGYNVSKLTASEIPFIDIARGAVGAAAFVAYLAGLTSTLGALIAGTNSQARLIFSAGREGLLPSFIGKVHPTRRTPTSAIFVFVSISLLIIGGWGLGHILNNHSGSMNPV